MKKIILLAVALFSFASLQAQPWMRKLKKDANFYEVQKAFNKYWEGKKIEKGKGWKQFKRWENFIEPRVYPSGKFPAGQLWKEQVKRSKNKQKSEANWEHLGPFNVPGEINSNKPQGVGRVNCVAFHPTDNNTIWIGAPGGGAWKTTDGGENWTTTTDQLLSLGVSDIVIDQKNPEIVYIGTGDRDGGNTYSVGVLKSSDGGQTWNTTEFNVETISGLTINRLVMHSENTDTIIAATNNGIYRTIDGFETYTKVQDGNFMDLHFKPNNQNIVYAAEKDYYGSPKIYKSTDNGLTFSEAISGFANDGNAGRIELAVTADNAEVVYALVSRSDNNGFHSLYKSTNSADSWTLKTSSSDINLLGWNGSGTDAKGQGFYDLSLEVNPQDEGEVFVGGVNIWRTTDSGQNWAIAAHWVGNSSIDYVHADQHMFRYRSSDNTLFAGNDGGIYKTSNGTDWTDISGDLQILQIYRLGTSATNANINITGNQDNGTYKCDGENWYGIIGGDGMECLIDYSNSDIMYGELYYGAINRSTDGGKNFYSIAPASNGAWVTPYVIHPTNPATLYAGYTKIYKSTDRGDHWEAISSTLSAKMKSLAIAPSNDNYIYTGSSKTFYKTENGGTDWTTIRTGLPDLSMTYISVSPDNPETLWITMSGYTEGKKVYKSIDGGETWVNYSTGLPNIPANCIVYQNGTDDKLYVGTDLGVYYRDNTMDSWAEYNDGLPNVVINELEIHYGTSKLRAATYGRGIWQTDLHGIATLAPSVNFTVNETRVCGQNEVEFKDLSGYNPTSWEWTFEPNTVTFKNETSANSQNPVVSFNEAGKYTVKLKATNVNGNNIETKTDYLEQALAFPDFEVNRTVTHIDGVLRFSNLTHCTADSYEWTFEPNTVEFVESTSSTSRNCNVKFQELGDYTVTLKAITADGNITETKTNYIKVGEDVWMSSGDVNTCDTYFYDAQGPQSSYYNNENYEITFFPSEEGKKVKVSFVYFVLEASDNCKYDYLSVYDGTVANTGIHIGKFCGTDIQRQITATNETGTLTFKFHSDEGSVSNGWKAKVTCVDEAGIESESTIKEVKVYPNPNNGTFAVEYTSEERCNIEMAVFDSQGRKIRQSKFYKNMDTKKKIIDLSNCAKGIYFIEIITPNQIINKKVMVK